MKYNKFCLWSVFNFTNTLDPLPLRISAPLRFSISHRYEYMLAHTHTHTHAQKPTIPHSLPVWLWAVPSHTCIHTRASWKAAIFFGPSRLTTVQAVTLTHTNCDGRHSSSATWHRCTIHSTTGCPLCSCADETKQCRRGNGPQEKRMLKCQLKYTKTSVSAFAATPATLTDNRPWPPGWTSVYIYLYIQSLMEVKDLAYTATEKMATLRTSSRQETRRQPSPFYTYVKVRQSITFMIINIPVMHSLPLTGRELAKKAQFLILTSGQTC